jgi:hypothetical protein
VNNGRLLLLAAAGEAHQHRPSPARHRDRPLARTLAAQDAGIELADIDQEGIAADHSRRRRQASGRRPPAPAGARSHG